MRNRTKYTISYSCVQASFWMSLCVFSGFGAVYMQALGYSNATLGLILACGTLAGSVLGPELSSAIDRSSADRLTASGMMPKVIAAEAAATLVMLLVPAKGIVTSVAFVAFIALATTVNSLVLKLYSDAVYCGMDIDYGMSRSMGSLGYVLTSFAVGSLCEAISTRAVPAAGLAVCAFQLVSFLKFSGFLKGAQEGTAMQKYLEHFDQGSVQSHVTGEISGTGADNAARSAAETANEAASESAAVQETGTTGSASIAAFLIRNKAFCLILAGSILIFFSHNTLCNFFINVVRNVGGSTSDMGFLNGLMALIEIPVIFFYTRLTRNFRTSTVLRTGFIFFTAKAAAVALAGSVAGIAGALLLQAPSFGLYTGAIVPYVDEVISHEDSAKAQSLAFSVTMLGSVFASTISGHLFDVMPVTSVMWISAAVCAVGSVLAVLGVRGTRN